MLLENNTNKVINLIYQFDDLSNIDKVRLAIYLLENKNFNANFYIEDMINALKLILRKLDTAVIGAAPEIKADAHECLKSCNLILLMPAFSAYLSL